MSQGHASRGRLGIRHRYHSSGPVGLGSSWRSPTCLNKKVLAGVAIAAAAVYLLAPGLIGAALPVLVVAICPLSAGHDEVHVTP